MNRAAPSRSSRPKRAALSNFRGLPFRVLDLRAKFAQILLPFFGVKVCGSA